MSRRAVIDVGTNSVKLLLAEVKGSAVEPLLETSRQTRLGRGFYESHQLQPGPVAETAKAVVEFARRARQGGAESLRIIATSAARDARNPEVLQQAIETAAGQPLETISGEQEASWAFQGVMTDPRLAGHPLLILDVGGGSTEFVLGEAHRPHFRGSYPMGAVRLLETCRPAPKPTLAQRDLCLAGVSEFLAAQVKPLLEPALANFTTRQPFLIGTGGTASVLGAMELKLTAFDRARLEALCLTEATVWGWFERLWAMSHEERQRVPGLPPERADVILTGVAIYLAVLRCFGFNQLRVSTRGLRFGAVAAQPALGDAREEALRAECLALMRALDATPQHPLQVARLALDLFDQLPHLHGLGGADRFLLEAAAYLHDIGWRAAPDGKGHHKESARMIREFQWRHADPETVALIAEIARYHRKSLPDPHRHATFARLAAADQLRVSKLAALLRMADGLDRTHLHRVRGLQVRPQADGLEIAALARQPIASELAAADKKADLARKVYGCDWRLVEGQPE